MRDLKDVRVDINETDAKIIELFEKRMDLSIEVANYKIANSLPIFDSKREAEKLEGVRKSVKNDLYADWAVKLMGDLMTYSKEYQKSIMTKTDESKTTVAFQGLPGANSEEAAIAYFGKVAEYRAHETFEDVFSAVEDGSCGYGVVPFENFSTGTISDVFNLLLKYDLYIVGEYKLKINHRLLGCEGASLSTVKKVISHPQALDQCTKFLNSLDGVEKQSFLNTALAAKHVAEASDPTLAAIASPRACEKYGLKVLAGDIANSDKNTTRFIVISKTKNPDKNTDKVSLVFGLSHTCGSLAKHLSYFAKYNTNILKIESRPIDGIGNNCNFFVDFETDPKNEHYDKLIACLEENSSYFKLLGNYKKMHNS